MKSHLTNKFTMLDSNDDVRRKAISVRGVSEAPAAKDEALQEAQYHLLRMLC